MGMACFVGMKAVIAEPSLRGSLITAVTIIFRASARLTVLLNDIESEDLHTLKYV